MLFAVVVLFVDGENLINNNNNINNNNKDDDDAIFSWCQVQRILKTTQQSQRTMLHAQHRP